MSLPWNLNLFTDSMIYEYEDYDYSRYDAFMNIGQSNHDDMATGSGLRGMKPSIFLSCAMTNPSPPPVEHSHNHLEVATGVYPSGSSLEGTSTRAQASVIPQLEGVNPALGSTILSDWYGDISTTSGSSHPGYTDANTFNSQPVLSAGGPHMLDGNPIQVPSTCPLVFGGERQNHDSTVTMVDYLPHALLHPFTSMPTLAGPYISQNS